MHKIFTFLQKWLLAVVDDSVSITTIASPKGGLVLVRLDAIGDFILWLDTAKEYRYLFPGKKITLVANNSWAELAESLPYWDEVWPIELQRFTRSPLYRWKVMHRIRQAGFELSIQPTFSRVFLHGDSIVRATMATQRIGSSGDTSNASTQEKASADNWYTRLLPATAAPLMELERNTEFIRELSGMVFKTKLPSLPVLMPLPERLQLQEGYFIVFPGASWYGRQWPIELFAEILTRLQRRYGWRAVLCGSKAEVALCQSVADVVEVECLNLAGQTTLTEFSELIRGACLLIGNETSSVHFAAAVGTPAVCILGGGHYGRFMPYPDGVEGLKPMVAAYKMPCYHCNWNCNQPHEPGGPVPCIANVTVESVFEQAQRAIDQSIFKN